jgi:hypothetical protein
MTSKRETDPVVEKYVSQYYKELLTLYFAIQEFWRTHEAKEFDPKTSPLGWTAIAHIEKTYKDLVPRDDPFFEFIEKQLEEVKKQDPKK